MTRNLRGRRTFQPGCRESSLPARPLPPPLGCLEQAPKIGCETSLRSRTNTALVSVRHKRPAQQQATYVSEMRDYPVRRGIRHPDERILTRSARPAAPGRKTQRHTTPPSDWTHHPTGEHSFAFCTPLACGSQHHTTTCFSLRPPTVGPLPPNARRPRAQPRSGRARLTASRSFTSEGDGTHESLSKAPATGAPGGAPNAAQTTQRPHPLPSLQTGGFAYPHGPHGDPPWVNGDPPRASDAGRAAAPTVSAENPPGPTTTYGAQDPVVPTAGPAWLTGASDWPEFAALREAASGTNMSKFRRLAGVLITSARVAFAAALAEVGHGEASQPDSSTAKAASYYAILATVASGFDRGLQDAWHWPEAAALTLERFAARLIGGPEPYAIAAPHLPSTLKSCVFSPSRDQQALSNIVCPSSSPRWPAGGNCSPRWTCLAPSVLASTRKMAAASALQDRPLPTPARAATSSQPRAFRTASYCRFWTGESRTSLPRAPWQDGEPS